MENNWYSISLCLSIEAKNESDAINLFNERVQLGQYKRDSIDVEVESDNDPDDPCESCRKLGETICGNDTEYHRCYEPLT